MCLWLKPSKVVTISAEIQYPIDYSDGKPQQWRNYSNGSTTPVRAVTTAATTVSPPLPILTTVTSEKCLPSADTTAPSRTLSLRVWLVTSAYELDSRLAIDCIALHCITLWSLVTRYYNYFLIGFWFLFLTLYIDQTSIYVVVIACELILKTPLFVSNCSNFKLVSRSVFISNIMRKKTII